ncbi:uncharacterized protein F4822DRAFT_424005 [Hypoxylon trugodes]|uniref:uncharacterized protein n=1 Tax=Hypoxylon trugodes TaxID=326681 RepID=UPI0021916EED|nr:uncharacterized protein F4822DRAFT_424005 [Hypoxylon trugodes]KAI1393536.1 hypothetical protein F4822DRAFT_424005 [Hypoxylon trugodes]
MASQSQPDTAEPRVPEFITAELARALKSDPRSDIQRRYHHNHKGMIYMPKLSSQMGEIEQFSVSLLDQLRSAIKEPCRHVERLNDVLSCLVLIWVDSHDPHFPPDADSKAHNLLSRLGAWPAQFSQAFSAIEGIDLYCRPGSSSEDISRPTSLSVSHQPNIIEVRIALVLIGLTSSQVLRSGWDDLAFRLAVLLDYLYDLIHLHVTSSSDVNAGNVVIEWYLRCTWYRTTVLFLWSIICRHLRFGYDIEVDHLISLKGGRRLLEDIPTLADISPHSEKTDQPPAAPYMCNWALQLLKTDQASHGLGVTSLVSSFNRLFQGLKPRCSPLRDKPCSGAHPLDCGRFTDRRLVKPDQSIHDTGCPGCSRIKWDESSYNSLQGKPRAVGINTSHNLAEYVEASHSTLAISHVWSHGHGGRPSTGMNFCLHRRFSKIARQHGCDSYWIDTLCIPEDHTRRWEAILFINQIFQISKVTIIIDQDLMSIKVADADQKDPSRETAENVLVALLLCDWNVRAWTMLEAVKGSINLHVLCSDNRTISVRSCLEKQCYEGYLDLALFFLSTRHLLPINHKSIDEDTWGQIQQRSLEDAASMLSHRHATRKGDEIVIWSLLMSERKTYFKAEDLWIDMVEQDINTGFLMSDVPRINIPLFSWAPSSPYARESEYGRGKEGQSILVYNGEGSFTATITENGLYGTWLVHYLRPHDVRDCDPRLKDAYDLFQQYSDVALLCPIKMGGTGVPYTGYNTGQNRGSEENLSLFAICASNNKKQWKWQKVVKLNGMNLHLVNKQMTLI